LIDVEQTMLSANAKAVPLVPGPLQSNGFDGAWRAIGRFLSRLVRRGPRRAPGLPDDLCGDVGFCEGLPFDRESAFWETKQRSHARDLPL
jgi:hypothetical protein